MSGNEIDAYHTDFDSYMPDEHRIEVAAKVYLVFEDGRWCLDALIQQSEPLDEARGTQCSYEQPRQDRVICSTPQGRTVVEAADPAARPRGLGLLDMLAAEFGFDLVPAGMAGPDRQITRLTEQVQELLDKKSEIDQLGEQLVDAFVAAVDLSAYLNLQTRRGRLRVLLAHITRKPADDQPRRPWCPCAPFVRRRPPLSGGPGRRAWFGFATVSVSGRRANDIPVIRRALAVPLHPRRAGSEPPCPYPCVPYQRER
ncbi:hypothetical protein [Nocardia pseudovaccinii]|uniref:hypothetical protein n=1 Tax=Nocardia pseudovaccinii TaxID=189540 RepID=UPI0007A54D09|nr:hypothetical protein [Nocardia pseudovaccinii]